MIIWNAILNILLLRYWKIYFTAPKIDIVCTQTDFNEQYHFDEDTENRYTFDGDLYSHNKGF